MTTPNSAPHIHRTDELVAALPHLVGFHPAQSLVVVWIGAGRVILTQRVDIPDAAGRRAVLAGRAEWVFVPTSAAARADAAAAVLCCDDEADLHAVMPLVDRVHRQIEQAGVVLLDIVHLASGRFRSLLCDGPCCPPEGRAVSPAVVEAAEAAFAFDGRAVLPDRAALVAQVAADPLAIAEVAGLLPQRPRRARRGDRWRDAAITEVLDVVLGRPTTLSADRRASVLRSLCDVRVRDTVLWDLAQVDADQAAAATTTLASLARSAPDALCAPVATCCAIAAWLTGDGALAGAAVERALAAERGYGLAGLIDAALRAGWPPDAWRSIIGELDRATCRRGLPA